MYFYLKALRRIMAKKQSADAAAEAKPAEGEAAKTETKPEPKFEPKPEPKFESKPEPREPAATPGKNLFENLEEEMANLLGRPPGKS